MFSLYKFQSLKEAAQLSLEETKDFDKLADSLLTEVVLETIRSYQQKLAVGIEDSASDLLDNFKKKVVNHIFECASGWQTTQDESFLFPRGCRFCFRRNKTTVLVIEQEPQVRTLKFATGMQEENMVVTFSETENVALSLPYTIFVFTFQSGQMNVRCFWRTAPLRSLDDFVCAAVLPNIHVGGLVCQESLFRSSISESAEKFISDFWNSKFNADLSTAWDSKGTISDKLRTGRIWAENSINDPLFILGVSLKIHKSLKEVIDFMVLGSEQPRESVFRHKIEKEIDSCVDSLFHKITSYMKKTKFEKHSPKNIKELVQKQFQTAVCDLVDIIMVLNNEIDKFSFEVNVEKKPIVKAGKMWS